MSHITAIKCDFCPQEAPFKLFEDDSQRVSPVGGEYHICYTCMHRMPTSAERMRYLNIAIDWDEAHPSYIQEKTDIAISAQTLDFLLSALDYQKQREFIEQM